MSHHDPLQVVLHLDDVEKMPARIAQATPELITLVPLVPVDQRRLLGDSEVMMEYATPRGLQRVTGKLVPDGHTTEILQLFPSDSYILQRRAWYRVDAVVPIVCITQSGANFTTNTLELSGGNARVLDDGRLPVGTTAQVAVEVSTSELPVKIIAEVVRRCGERQTAIVFEEIGKHDHQALIRFITERQRTELALARH